MAMFTFDISPLRGISDAIETIAKEVQKNERAAISAAGHAYQRDVQRIAPVDTGQYRASIRVEMAQEDGHPVALIGTPMPQACRLEYGFWGMTDRIGRTFHQRPRPHWRPAFDLNKIRYGNIIISRLGGTVTTEGISGVY